MERTEVVLLWMGAHCEDNALSLPPPLEYTHVIHPVHRRRNVAKRTDHPPRKRRKDSFSEAAKEVKAVLRKCRALLLDNVQAYSTFQGGMTDRERDEIDDKVGKYLSWVGKQLENLRAAISDADLALAREGSFVAYKHSCIGMMMDETQELSKVSGDLQLLRMKRAVMSRPSLAVRDGDTGFDSTSVRKRKKPNNSDTPALVEEHGEDDEFDDLGEELRKELELENLALQSKLEEELSGVIKAEQQLSQISELLNVFNEKLVEQRDYVEFISEQTKKSVQVMDQGNEQLRKTDQRYKNDLRVFYIFLFASLLLLWLDS